ncbi:MAG TPA: TadE/TadG family type IV pilus assembly protein [Candidatus Saccharimonadales bacterium]|nr:TadE/TadG family type IV pilus assembly protein [Candidatus Saccharimonadales bacterium]
MEIELQLKGGGQGKLMAKCLQKETFTRMRRLFGRRLASDTRGQELVEFAFVFWILMALYILVFWCGRAYSIYQAVERAAREGARVSLMSSCATCGNAPNDPTAAINNALTAASLDPTLALPPPLIQQNQTLVPGNSPNYDQVSGVTVTVNYPFQVNLPLLGWMTSSGTIPSINISSTVSMKQEY